MSDTPSVSAKSPVVRTGRKGSTSHSRHGRRPRAERGVAGMSGHLLRLSHDRSPRRHELDACEQRLARTRCRRTCSFQGSARGAGGAGVGRRRPMAGTGRSAAGGPAERGRTGKGAQAGATPRLRRRSARSASVTSQKVGIADLPEPADLYTTGPRKIAQSHC